MESISAAAATPNGGPLVLIVEDEFDNRKAKVGFFEEFGFSVIAAESLNDAERELRACPLVDLIVTDVNLDSTKPRESSGVDLARRVKQRHPDLPIIGYSGRFEEGDLAEDQKQVFEAINLKGNETPKAMRACIGDWRARAEAYRAKRAHRSSGELSRLKVKYAIGTHDFNLLREFIPGGIGIASPGDPPSVEDVLRDAGFSLRIIEKGELHLTISDGVRAIQYPIPIWIQNHGSCVIVEVYRFPELYASAGSEQDALEQLLLLMDGFYQDLRNAQDETLGLAMRHLRDYLQQIFG